jgi:hypothetical protein
MLPAGKLDEVEHVELIGIINKLLLLHLVGCLYYCISDARSYKHQFISIRCENIVLKIEDFFFCGTLTHTGSNSDFSE